MPRENYMMKSFLQLGKTNKKDCKKTMELVPINFFSVVVFQLFPPGSGFAYWVRIRMCMGCAPPISEDDPPWAASSYPSCDLMSTPAAVQAIFWWEAWTADRILSTFHCLPVGEIVVQILPYKPNQCCGAATLLVAAALAPATATNLNNFNSILSIW